LESRKYQLKTQIIEALKAKDNDLSSLLKSQWAHRFGVESLEEFKNLDLKQVNENLVNESNQKIDQSKNYFFEDEKVSSSKDDNFQDKEIENYSKKVIEAVNIQNNQSFEIKSNGIDKQENIEKNTNYPVIDYKNPPKVDKLIPLPPKPKYNYLKKWLLRN
tara:strand:+ start:283 stop:765 length:483 start_codon:yes stop_codon:yes gene_type:complete